MEIDPWQPGALMVIALIFLLAGAVKGVVGLGLPTVSLGLLTVVFGLKGAMVLMIVPSFSSMTSDKRRLPGFRGPSVT